MASNRKRRDAERSRSTGLEACTSEDSLEEIEHRATALYSLQGRQECLPYLMPAAT